MIYAILYCCVHCGANLEALTIAVFESKCNLLFHIIRHCQRWLTALKHSQEELLSIVRYLVQDCGISPHHVPEWYCAIAGIDPLIQTGTLLHVACWFGTPVCILKYLVDECHCDPCQCLISTSWFESKQR